VSTIDVGNRAETEVAEDLARRGFCIVDRNWRTRWCEVDIIAKKDGVVWFVEVKYRSTTKFGDGLDYIGPKKLRHMQRAAELWVTIQDFGGEYTLGAIAVSDDEGIGELLEI
jgi:Holliday junction resolvase-like predicted endonuclease